MLNGSAAYENSVVGESSVVGENSVVETEVRICRQSKSIRTLMSHMI